MNINSLNNYHQTNLNFKAVYPAVHWVTDGGKYYRASGNVNKKLQRIIINILNKSDNKSKKALSPEEQNFKSYVERCDLDYRNNPVVRSFYNKVASLLDNFSDLIYIISGNNVKKFENRYAKNIGRTKSGKYPELEITKEGALEFYNNVGFKYVSDRDNRLKDRNGTLYTLNTKFRTIRNKSGKIVGYKFEDARFLPNQK